MSDNDKIVVEPEEWVSIREADGKGDIDTILKFADYRCGDIYDQYSIQNRAIFTLRKYPQSSVTEFLLEKFDRSESVDLRKDIAESVAAHDNDVAAEFSKQYICSDNGMYLESIVDGLENIDKPVDDDLVEVLKEQFSCDNHSDYLRSKIFNVIARTDKRLGVSCVETFVSDLINRDVDIDEFESSVQYLLEICSKHRITMNLDLMRKLSERVGNEYIVHEIVVILKRSRSKKAKDILKSIKSQFSYSDVVNAAIGGYEI